MAEAQYQSLYRRFRPQRFADVRGQDHVTRALRNAVRENRIGHAYLFSGPRGTGKTSTARILAKVLNCANPQDGEPCGVCDNCLAVQRGQVVDWLLEQDAASKSKVDDMRDLLDRVPLGTSGNRKVIILDEVHMLSQGAENALLKTLEEPPSHVVFVLATTDPQKVRPTIRSRTQHFEFHLLPPDVMTDHIRHVIEEADLPLGEDAVNHVVRAGGGSARDTLSALDQVAALGEVVADNQPVDAILDGLVSGDAGAVLVAVADAMATGREPRTLGEALIARLRDAFLAVMGVADQHLPEAERTRASELGEKLGPAGLTRALEVLGDALVELSRKPDPRIVVEVALIRLVRPDADNSTDALMARIERLEQAVRDGGDLPPAAPPSSAGPGGAAAPPPAPAAPAPSAPGPTETGPSSGASRPADGARAALAANRPTGKGKGSSTKPTASAAPLPGGEADPADASVTQVVASDVASGEASGGGVAVMATPRTADPPASAPSDAGQAELSEAHGDAMPTVDPASTRSPAPAGSATPTPTPPGDQGSVAPASTPTATGSTPSASAPTAAVASSTVTPEASAESPTATSTPITPSAPAPAASTGSASASPTSAGPLLASAGPAGASSGPAAASAASPAGPPKQVSPPGAQASATAGQAPSASTAAPSRPASQASSPTSVSSAAPASSTSAAPAAGAGMAALERAWPQILAELPISVRSKWRGGRWAEPSPDGGARFAVDNSWHQKACEEGQAEVEKIVAAQLGDRVQIQVVVEGGRSAEASTGGLGGPGGPSPAGPPPDADDGIEDIADVSQLADANDVATGGVDLLLREFGGELVEEDPR